MIGDKLLADCEIPKDEGGDLTQWCYKHGRSTYECIYHATTDAVLEAVKAEYKATYTVVWETPAIEPILDAVRARLGEKQS